MKADEKDSFRTRIIEIRDRLIRCVIAASIGFAIAYYYSDKIFELMTLPLRQYLGPNGTFIYTGLTEMFFIYVKVGFFFGLAIAAPYIFYQIWAFASPGISRERKNYILLTVISCCALFMGGVFFGYFFVFPVIFQFLLSFANEHIIAYPSVKEYLSLALKLLIVFGIIFEVPVLVFFLSRIGLVSVHGFRRNRKYAILLAFIIGALIAPDVVSQFMIAIPFILLYEIGIIVAWLSGRK